MAESFDKNDIKFDDDFIKSALITSLSGIEASNDLISETISKCHSAIDLNKKEKDRKSILPWVYRLGAPLAVGAIVLVFMLNGNHLLIKSNDMAEAGKAKPFPSSAPVTEANDFVAGASFTESKNDAQDKRTLPQISFSQEIESTMSAAPSSTPELPKLAKGFDYITDGNIQSMNSFSYTTDSNYRAGEEASNEVFMEILSKYNVTNRVSLTMSGRGAIYVNALVEGGVDIELLKTVKSYKEILSNSGYYVLPLVNQYGNIDVLLSVNRYDSKKESANEVSVAEIKYASEQGDYTAVNNSYGSDITEKVGDVLFDSEKIETLFKEAGYKDISEILIVDINYGMDFVVFATADGKELCLPLMITDGLLGIENRKVYKCDEFFKIVGEKMQK